MANAYRTTGNQRKPCGNQKNQDTHAKIRIWIQNGDGDSPREALVRSLTRDSASGRVPECPSASLGWEVQQPAA